MNQKLVSVKNYHLNGDGVRVAFSMENSDELELVFEDGQGEHKFSGRAIFREHTQAGFMPSVVLEQAPDLHTVTFTLAVPAANIPDNMKSIPIKTFAIRTTSRTSIGGSQLIEGQTESYEVLVLEGNAW